MKRERDRAAAGAVEDDALRFLGQLAPRGFEVEVVGAGEAGRGPACNKGEGGCDLAQGTTAPFLIDERVVGDDEVGVEDHLLPEAVAGGAGALRGVEGEQARLDLGDGEAGDRAGEFLGEDDAAGGA